MVEPADPQRLHPLVSDKPKEPIMNERDPYSRQQYGGHLQDTSRQTNQWQSDAWGPSTSRRLQQDDEERSSYDDMERRDYRFSGMNDTHPEYRSSRSDFGGRDDHRDWRSGRGYRERWGSSDDNRRVHPQHFYDPSYGNDYSSFTSEDYGGRDFYAGRGGVARGMRSGGMRSSESYRPEYGMTRWFGDDHDNHRHHDSDYGEWRSYGERRGFLDKAGDEIASWFGDEDAARRREMDHAGRGPSDYIRSDERIREDVNDHLTRDPGLDATNVSVSVTEGEVTLNGTVHDRWSKRRAEDVADRVSGAKHVQNNLRIAGQGTFAGSSTTGGGWSSSSGMTSETGSSERPH